MKEPDLEIVSLEIGRLDPVYLAWNNIMPAYEHERTCAKSGHKLALHVAVGGVALSIGDKYLVDWTAVARETEKLCAAEGWDTAPFSLHPDHRDHKRIM